MNKKVLFLSTLALTGTLFVGCSEAPNNETYVETTSDLLVYARDAGTGGILTSARVTLLSIDKAPRAVDAVGNVTYNNLPVGYGYSVRVESAGYATVICTGNIEPIAAENISIVPNLVLQAGLNKLGASVQGTIVYQDPATTDTKLLPATGAQVELRLSDNSGSCSFEKKDFHRTVTADGSYKIDSLPENTTYSLYALPVALGGVNYADFTISSLRTGLVGSTVTNSQRTYATLANAIEFRIISAPSEIGTADSIKYTFSKAVNTEKIWLTPIEVHFAGVKVAVTTIWSSDKKNLTIVPVSGTWEAGNTYRVDIPQLISVEASSQKLVNSGEYYVDISTVDLSNLQITGVSYNSATQALQWKRLNGATQYHIYYKTATATVYTMIYTAVPGVCNTDGDCSYMISVNPGASYIIAGYNSRGLSRFSASATIPVVN